MDLDTLWVGSDCRNVVVNLVLVVVSAAFLCSESVAQPNFKLRAVGLGIMDNFG